MIFKILTHKYLSRGRFRDSVGNLVSKGDAARASRDWAVAQQYYEAALSKSAQLNHIWIQLGHARKEQGALNAAKEAYAKAHEIDMRDPDALLHLGHVSKLLGETNLALGYYLAAADLCDAGSDADREYLTLRSSIPADQPDQSVSTGPNIAALNMEAVKDQLYASKLNSNAFSFLRRNTIEVRNSARVEIEARKSDLRALLMENTARAYDPDRGA